MSMTFTAGDPPMSFNFCASNNAGDYSNSGGGQWQFDPNKYFTTDGTWITPPQEFVIQPSQDINIPWIIQDSQIISTPAIGQLRLNSASGMIEMWDGTNWVEYGMPIKPPPGIEQPPPAADDFELGGAL